ncbi:phage tail tape measure protein [Prevotella sp.]|uniref:phage tail tape measure protein n=1 Tax=Prevotella sp. TaxID=59823 RepID=UPI0027E2CB36|nr:phage tail tape measure protein [Prevotella sp.]
MSNINTNATVTLTVNGKQAEDMLLKLKSQAANLEKAIEKAAAAGNKQQLTKLKRELKETNRQISQIENSAKGVEHVLQRLDETSPKELNRTLAQLKRNLNGLERGSEEWNRQCEAIKRVKAEIAKVNSQMRENESLWERMNRKLNDWQTALAGIAAAITGIIMAGRSAVNAFADMDQEMANVRKFTGMNASEVEQLNEDFQKIDTRTGREELNKLAQEAGRLGKTSQEDVLGFVKAADQINVALDDLGDGATLTLSKLTNIFGDEERLGTEKALLAVGSVINELSQNCTASAPYLANFTQRMAGVGAQAKMTIPEIMGFAAVLDSQGQAVEMSATAVSKVIMDMFKENDKIIKATGLNAKEFNETLKKSTNEGLLMLLDRLHELGNIDVLAPVFKDMGENGARAAQVISALAGNLDMVRWEQEEATKAFAEGTSVTNEFNVQNSTVQAGLDKARKGVTEMAVALGEQLQPIMKHVISSTTLLLKFMSTSITFIKENAFTLASLTAAFIAYKIAVNASNIAFKAHYAWLVISKAATTAYKTTVATLHAAHLLLQMGLAKLQGNWVRQSWLMSDLKKQGALLASGYGAIAAGAIALGAVLYKLYKKMTEVSQAEKDLQEIRKRGQEGIIDEKNNIDALIAVARDETQSLKDRHTAIDALNKIIPNYNAQLDDTTGKYKENKKALDDYLKSLTRKYEIEGAKDKLRDIGKQRVDLNLEKQRQERVVAMDEMEARTETVMPGQEGKVVQLGVNSLRASNRRALAKTKEDLAELDQREANILGIYGEDIKKEALNDAKKEQKREQQTQNPPYTPTKTDKKTKTEDVLKPQKDWKTREQALNRIAYAKGEKDFEEYTNRMTEIDMEYNQKVMANGKATSEQKLEAEAAYYEAKKKLADDKNTQSAKQENDYYNELVATEKQRYIDGKVDQKTFDDALELMELEHLRRLTKVYTDGSKEQLQAQKNYQNKLVENQKRNQKTIEDNEKKHQKELAKVKEDYFGDNKSEKKEKYTKYSAALDEVFKQEIKAAGDDAQEKLRIEEAYQKAKVALAKKYGQEYNDTSKNFLENMTEDITEWLNSDLGQAVQGSFDTLTSGMSSIFSGMTSLIQAELEIQTAAIEKRYDKEISQAEGNNYKVKKLEEQKQKELAKKKNEANKKMFAMQVIQAVAQTAQNAISAYGSAAAIPLVGYILAPVAAAMAVAAGAIQIAAIKKQQQASESQGYAKGGFTPKGSKFQEVGVVHAGEWVASQEMLANPVARPIINALDFAQRTNTIGSLRADDVSRTIAPVAYSTPQQQQPIIVQQQPDGLATAAIVQNTKVMQSYADTMKQLEKRLSEPFVTVNTVTGDTGIKQAQDEYSILMRNKTPKSRRK